MGAPEPLGGATGRHDAQRCRAQGDHRSQPLQGSLQEGTGSPLRRPAHRRAGRASWRRSRSSTTDSARSSASPPTRGCGSARSSGWNGATWTSTGCGSWSAVASIGAKSTCRNLAGPRDRPLPRSARCAADHPRQERPDLPRQARRQSHRFDARLLLAGDLSAFGRRRSARATALRGSPSVRDDGTPVARRGGAAWRHARG